MKLDTIFKDAEELSMSTATTITSEPAVVQNSEWHSGGWMCSQNSTQNANWSELRDEVENFAEPSGDTLLFLASSIKTTNAHVC